MTNNSFYFLNKSQRFFYCNTYGEIMRFHVISFGQRGYYYDLSNNLLKRIKKRYPHAKTRTYSELDLNNEIREYATQYKRGYGYWQWKPFIILNHLREIDDNEILFYIDGRSQVIDKRIPWLDSLENVDFDIAISGGFKEFQYSSYPLLQHFNVINQYELLNTKQYFATFLLIRKNKKTTTLISQWLNNLLKFPEIFRDSENLSSLKLDGFIANRHDQSALSILIKLSTNLKVVDISDDVFSSGSLLLHYNLHKRWYSKIHNYLRLVLPKWIYVMLVKIYSNNKY